MSRTILFISLALTAAAVMAPSALSVVDPNGRQAVDPLAVSYLRNHGMSPGEIKVATQGLDLLARSASGDELTAYHLEAAIAAEHARATSIDDTDWSTIVWLYDRLLLIEPSPVIALNRAIAIAQRDGPERGLDALEAIADRERLDAYPFYRAALGELEWRRGRLDAARDHFAAALPLARNPTERRFLEKRVRACSGV